jgi:hypothetical protein
MALYPAGLSCGLSGIPPFSSSSNAQNQARPAATTTSGPTDFAVGGGQAPGIASCPAGVPANFGMDAHVAADTLTQGVGGSFDITAPTINCHGHLSSTVDCLRVVGNRADFTSFVTQANGNLAAFNGKEIATEVLDSTTPGTPDMINDAGPVSGPCDFEATPNQPVVHGNVVVQDAQ